MPDCFRSEDLADLNLVGCTDWRIFDTHLKFAGKEWSGTHRIFSASEFSSSGMLKINADGQVLLPKTGQKSSYLGGGIEKLPSRSKLLNCH